MTNLQLLIDRYETVTLTTAQIMDLLHIEKRQAFYNMVTENRVPFPTYRAGRQRIANITDVAAWMDTPTKSRDS